MADYSLSRLEELFERATALPAHERDAFLDAACQGDPRLRAAVEGLLQTDASLGPDDDFLTGPVRRARAAAQDATASLRIDGYRILRKLGDGGMGSVYEAQQDNPRRRVAIKVIRPGMASRDTVKRFHLEAQVLGRLHHPGIAQVYAAGLAADSQPFIALEYIRGLPLLCYARQHQLDVLARIGLVARVCDAVEYAHSQGVIHRDLKPANILVDETGRPKVLDFGVARATDVELQTSAAHTQAGQLIGTLAYMSPEQITADPTAIDHRTDVYALGVVLFELLAEHLPFDLQRLPLPEAARVICERQPPTLGAVQRHLRGDAETIVAKALEKDPRQRYASAGALADDLRRYQAGEPIRARPISSAERLWRWARLHRSLAAALAVITVLIVAVAIGSTVAAFSFQESARQNAQLAEDNELARRKAEQAGAAERWERYRANMATAASALQTQNLTAAKGALEAAPPEHHNWEWRHFRSQLDTSSAVLVAPLPLKSAVFSADGQRVSAGAWESPQVFVWSTRTSQLLHALPGPPGALRSVLSPDGNHAAFGTDQGRIQVVDLVTGQPTVTWAAHQGKVTALTFSADSQRLASAGADHTVRLWDVKAARCSAALVGQGEPAVHLALSADGQRLLVDSDTTCLWDVPRQQCIATLDEGMSRSSPSFSADSRRVLVGTDYPLNRGRLWDAVTGQHLLDLRGHQNRIFHIAASPDGRRLATASQDQTLRLWEGSSGRLVAVLRGHTSAVFGLAFSPDGRRLVSASNDAALRVWSADDGELLEVLRGHEAAVQSATWSRDGHRLASASEDRTLRLWDLPEAGGRGVLRGHRGYVYDVACRPDGAQLASAAWDGTVRLWDIAAGQETAALRHDKTVVMSIAYDAHGQQLAAAADGNQIVLWDLASGKPRHTIATRTVADTRLAIDPQGQRLAVGSTAGFVRFFAVADGAPAGVLGVGAGEVRDVAFRPDGQQMACASSDGTISLWQRERPERLALLRGLAGSPLDRLNLGREDPDARRINAVVYSKDGRLLASASNDRTARVWDAATGRELLPPLVHADTVWKAAFSPDGQRLATACADNTIRLWDLATGQEVAELRGHQSYVKAVVFSPDGTQLFSGSGDFTVRVWDTVPVRDRAQPAGADDEKRLVPPERR